MSVGAQEVKHTFRFGLHYAAAAVAVSFSVHDDGTNTGHSEREKE